MAYFPPGISKLQRAPRPLLVRLTIECAIYGIVTYAMGRLYMPWRSRYSSMGALRKLWVSSAVVTCVVFVHRSPSAYRNPADSGSFLPRICSSPADIPADHTWQALSDAFAKGFLQAKRKTKLFSFFSFFAMSKMYFLHVGRFPKCPSALEVNG